MHGCFEGPLLELCGIYSKNASSVAIFLEVVHSMCHCSVDEYLRKILQHLHELHRKGPYFLCCDDKEMPILAGERAAHLLHLVNELVPSTRFLLFIYTPTGLKCSNREEL